MAKIYIDTTRLIDFYRVTDDKIVQLEELQKHKRNIVLTEQTRTEFRRNRVTVLKQLQAEFKKILDYERPPNAAIIQRLPARQELIELSDKRRKEIFDYLNQLINDENTDPIARAVLNLYGDPEVNRINLKDVAIEKAHRRKLLGNPPCSPDKYTIGDEVIWELLLELKEDLIIVTTDSTYDDNFPILRDEYKDKTGRNLLLITDKLSEAVKKIGEIPPEELVSAEEKEDAWRRWNQIVDDFNRPFPISPAVGTVYRYNPDIVQAARALFDTDVSNPGPIYVDEKDRKK